MHTKVGLKRDNHYLPVCYQKGFVDSSRKVWVKYAGRHKPEHIYPKAVGKQPSFYIRTIAGVEDDKIEEFFGKSIENDFARLSQRTKRERDRLAELTGKELGALGKFVASQVVRNPANKRCIEEQMGRSVRTNEFLTEMGKQMRAIIGSWAEEPPSFEFYTSLPWVGEHFITGDDPVVLEIAKDGPIWTPTDNARPAISPIEEILNGPGVLFTIALSPYVCVLLRPHGGGEFKLPPKSLDPSEVRRFNDKVRQQCRLFTLARDAGSLR